MKILCFGSLNIDYVYHVEHFVTPGETLASEKRDINCGGKGLNQGIAASLAGGEVFHAGKIGSDGSFLADMLNSKGVNTKYVKITDGITGHAIIQVDKNGQNCIILFKGENHNITTEEISHVLVDFSQGDIMILQNEINNLPYIMDKAFGKGIKIIFNPSPVTDAIKDCPLEKVSLFAVNEVEGNVLTGKTEPEEILDSMEMLYPDADVLLTLGSRGSVFSQKGKRYFCGIYKAPVVDTTGAGDTCLGYFVYSLYSGKAPAEALDIAAKASSLAISRKGAAVSIPSMAELSNITYEYREFK